MLLSFLALGAPAQELPKKVVFLAGAKSHGPEVHEYVKSARLLAVMLEHAANLEGVRAEVHLGGWPEDPSTLDDADAIVFLSDGQDGDLYAPVPYMTPERLPVLARQMRRGAGLVSIHFSTFAPDSLADEVLTWSGGYFDWQGEDGTRSWYSAITTLDTLVVLGTPDHPISRGVPPSFRLHDEFYHDIRFRTPDPRLRPILRVPALASAREHGDVVAWAVERADGERGFATTAGHFYRNWEHPAFRKLLLNAITWTAGAEVPAGGVEARFYSDREVTRLLFGADRKGLLLTGDNHPAHDWRATTAALGETLEREGDLKVDVSTEIEDLAQYDLDDYDFLVLNYANWHRPEGLSEAAREALTSYLKGGGGLLVLHFANGAFHRSLPLAGGSDWPEYRRIVRRVWDHDGGSGHDAYGPFTVRPTGAGHEITEGARAFETTDELYYGQAGDAPIEPLLVARSRDTGRHEPVAWAYAYGSGRVFQTVLGHDVPALRPPELQRILRRAARWVARAPQLDDPRPVR